jgi:hypothetical protein
MRNWKAITALSVTAVLLAGAIWMPVAAQNVSLSGKLTTGTTGTTAISLYPEGSAESMYSKKVYDGTYSFSDVVPGVYTLKAENKNRVTRSYQVTVTEETLTQDIKLCPKGDVNLDGKVNVVDTARIYAYVRKTGEITDLYAFACGDFTGDGKINVVDTARVYALIRNPAPEVTEPSDYPDWSKPSDPYDNTTPMDPFDPVDPEKEYPVPNDPIVDNEDAPIKIDGMTFYAPVKPGHLVHYWLYRVSDMFLSIEDPNVYVIYEGKTYTPVNGVLTIPKLYTDSTQNPVKIAIGNKGITTKTYGVILSYPKGHQMNPYSLSSGNLTTLCEEGNAQGVYYRFTAEKAGTLMVRIKDCIGAASGNVILTSDSLEGDTRSVSTEENGTDSVSMTVAAGETVFVNIVVNAENGTHYPEAAINTVVRFR